MSSSTPPNSPNSKPGRRASSSAPRRSRSSKGQPTQNQSSSKGSSPSRKRPARQPDPPKHRSGEGAKPASAEADSPTAAPLEPLASFTPHAFDFEQGGFGGSFEAIPTFEDSQRAKALEEAEQAELELKAKSDELIVNDRQRAQGRGKRSLRENARSGKTPQNIGVNQGSQQGQSTPNQVQQAAGQQSPAKNKPQSARGLKSAIAKITAKQQQPLQVLWEASKPVLLTTLVVASGLIALRQVGIFQTLEVRAYDFMLRQRPTPPPDDRLLIIGITELDIRRIERWPLPDEIFANVFKLLQAHQPRAIGLDIYRDFPQPPGYDALYEQFQQTNIIGIEKKPNLIDPVGVAPPPIDSKQIGFNDVSLDPDTALRRSILFMFEEDQTYYSFAFRLASLYLKAEGIKAEYIPGSNFGTQLGQARFEPLERHSGGYQTIQDGGYQLLINYRAAFSEQVATTVSLSDVLEGKLQPEQVKDKIVLIGSTAPSGKDYFFTPFTKSREGGLDMPGVVAHAQMVSQLVDAALGDRPLIQFWPEWLELVWLSGCVGLGAMLTLWLRHPLKLLIAQVGGACLLTVIHWLLFLKFIWVPVMLPLVGLLSSTIAAIAYSNYRIQQEQKRLIQQAEDQEQAILMLEMATRKAKLETSIQAPKPIQTPIQEQDLLADRYRVQKVLASGGFGVTYVAQDQQRPGSPECVVKQLRPTLKDPQFLEVARRLFKTEAEILEVVGRHSRIPQLLAYFEEGEDFYLVEELIEGTPLGDRLPMDRCLSDKVVFKMLRELLPTLAFIHERHIIHRDIKPNNIIHRPADDALVLIDFGAVKQIQPNLKAQPEQAVDQTIAIGTQGYAAPEQLAGHPRLNSDLYSLGVIAIRALTGVPPHLIDQDPDTGDLAWQQYSKCHASLSHIIHRMTRYHFADRYATADEALKDLLALL